jgi:prefoldin subunit 5
VEASASEVSTLNNPPKDRELHQKVQELNQAIESVRRQLEQLQPHR